MIPNLSQNPITIVHANNKRYMLFFIIFIILQLSTIACQQAKMLGPASKTDLATAAEESCGYVQNEYGERVSWKSNLPVNVYIDSSIPYDMVDVIKNAGAKWSSAAGKSLFIFQNKENATSVKPTIDKINSIYWSKEWDENKKTQQAITTLSFNGPLISEADIKINAKDYEYYIETPQNSLQVNFESLIIHELGHVLGFNHLKLKPTVMWPTLAPSLLRTEIYYTDIKTLKCEY